MAKKTFTNVYSGQAGFFPVKIPTITHVVTPNTKFKNDEGIIFNRDTLIM